MAANNKIPQLRVCVTSVCDKNCIYCRPHGENLLNDNGNNYFSLQDFINTINAIARHGVTEVRLTGGEPLLYRQIYELIRSIKTNDFIKKISLVTRSKNLKDEALRLKSSGLDSVTISIDSLNRRKVYKITNSDILKELIAGAHKCFEINLPIRINTVLMKGVNDSAQDIEEFIHFAGSLGPAKWKILDYMILPGQYKDTNKHQYFVNLKKITGIIQELGGKIAKFSTQPGGLGTPMSEFIMPNGVSVFIKDSTKGSHYSQECHKCELFPCQDALMALRLTSNGNLQTCLYRKDKLINFQDYVDCGIEKMDFKIKEILSYYQQAEFYHQAWMP